MPFVIAVPQNNIDPVCFSTLNGCNDYFLRWSDQDCLSVLDYS